MKQALVGLIGLISVNILPVAQAGGVILSPVPEVQEIVLAQKRLDLKTRAPADSINRGFADNIILSLHYLKGEKKNRRVDWERAREPFTATVVLNPGEVFAFHANALSEYPNLKATMNSRFFVDEGYKSVAGLGGNGH